MSSSGIESKNNRNTLALKVAFAVMIAVGRPSIAETSADSYVAEARQSIKAGNIQAGIIQLKNALQDEPDNAAVRLLLGQTYLAAGDYAAADKELTRARDLGLPRVQWIKDLGKALLMLGRADRIADELQVDANDPPEVRASILAIQALAELGERKVDSARAKLNEALSLQPENVDALVAMARLDANDKNYQEADRRIDKVLVLQPENFDALLIKAELSRLQKKLPEAVSLYTQVISKRPRELRALLGRAEANFEQKNFDAALADVNAVRNIRSDLPPANYLRGRILLVQKNLPGAQEALLDVLRFAPEHWPSYLLLGAIALQQGNLEQAQSYLSRFVAAQPSNLHARKLLAATEMKLKNPKKAIEVLEQEKANDDAQYLALLGSAYMQSGDVQKAGMLLQKAAEISPDQSAIRAQLALSMLASGEADKAISELETAVDLNQGLVQADIMLVLTLLQNKEFDKAVDTARSLVGKLPDNPMPYNLLGVAELGRQDFKAARSSFEQALKISPQFSVAELNLAQLDLREGNVDEATHRYMSILKQDPNNAQAMLALAAIADRAGNAGDALQWLEKAWDKNPSQFSVGSVLAERYLQRGERLKALQVARSLESAQADSPAVQRLLGIVLLANDDPANAKQAFVRYGELASKSPDPWQLKAGAEVRLKDFAAAEDALKQALSFDSKYFPSLVMKGELLLRDRRFSELSQVIAVLREAHPKSGMAERFEGDSFGLQSKWKEAAQAYQASLVLSPNSRIVQQLAKVLLLGGDGDKARDVLEEWLVEHPEDISVRMQLAVELQRIGKIDESIEQYKILLSKNGKYVPALNNLAWLYNEKGSKEAISLAEKARELAPDSPEVADTLGWVLTQNGDTERGVRILRQAAVQAPHLGDIRFHLAVALEKSGKPDEAKRELERLLGEDRSFEQQDSARAMLQRLK